MAAMTVGVLARPLILPTVASEGQEEFRTVEQAPPPSGDVGPVNTAPRVEGLIPRIDGVGPLGNAQPVDAQPRQEMGPPIETGGIPGEVRSPQVITSPQDGAVFEQRDNLQIQGSPEGMNGRPGQDQNVRSEEQQQEWEEMQKKQEEERKKMEERQLKEMKRSLTQAKRGLTSMRKTFDRAKAKGAPIPADCETAMTAAGAILATAEKAETMEQMQDANTEDLRDSFDTLNECRMTVDQILRARQLVKKLDRDIKNMDRRWTRAKRSPPADAKEIVNEGDALLGQIKTSRASIDALLKEGNVEDVEGVLEDDIYGRFDDMESVMRRMEVMRNAKMYLNRYKARLNQAKKTIESMKRKKEDTAVLEDILSQIEASYQELKSLKSGSEEFMDMLQGLMELDQEFSNQFQGDQDFSSKLFVQPSPADRQNELKLNF